MSSELSDTVQVPQVFEPGARLRGGREGACFVLGPQQEGLWFVYGMPFTDDELRSQFTVVAPAPRAGQRWLGGGRLVVLGESTVPVSKGLWLLERGLRFDGFVADAAPATLRASEAATREPSPPAPWTRAAARRLITETITSAKPRRPGAFTSAMCSMAETETPDASVILAACLAICCLEEDLPEHGAPAAWQVERARVLADDVFRSAAKLEKREKVPARVREAFEMYVARRARS
jgi:hypothetical protein